MENTFSRVNKFKEYRKEIANMEDDGFVDTRNNKNKNVDKVISSDNRIGMSDLLNVHEDFSNTHIDFKNENYEKHLQRRKHYYIGVTMFSIILILLNVVLGILAWGFNL